MHGQTTLGLIGKMGKRIEIIYSEDTPDLVEFKILSNRGAIKDIIQFDVKDVIDKLHSIEVFHDAYKRDVD